MASPHLIFSLQTVPKHPQIPDTTYTNTRISLVFNLQNNHRTFQSFNEFSKIVSSICHINGKYGLWAHLFQFSTYTIVYNKRQRKQKIRKYQQFYFYLGFGCLRGRVSAFDWSEEYASSLLNTPAFNVHDLSPEGCLFIGVSFPNFMDTNHTL